MMYTSITDEADQDVVMSALERAEVPCFVEGETVLVELSPCWPAVETVPSTGYARGDFHRKIVNKVFGKLKRGIVVDHLCRNRACICPAHLRLVNERENILCGVGVAAFYDKRTHCHLCGEELTPENVRIARTRRYGRIYEWRMCRTCDRVRQRRYREARAARNTK
jgi:hypothetical protein